MNDKTVVKNPSKDDLNWNDDKTGVCCESTRVSETDAAARTVFANSSTYSNNFYLNIICVLNVHICY